MLGVREVEKEVHKTFLNQTEDDTLTTATSNFFCISWYCDLDNWLHNMNKEAYHNMIFPEDVSCLPLPEVRTVYVYSELCFEIWLLEVISRHNLAWN